MKSIGDRLAGLKRFLHTFLRASDAEVTVITQFAQDRVLLETFFDSMDPETRQICSWRLQGFTTIEIARVLNVSVDVLSERYVQGLQNSADKVNACRKGMPQQSKRKTESARFNMKERRGSSDR